MLDALLDALRIRQYFNAVTMGREVVTGVRDDLSFLLELRRAVLPYPGEARGTPERQPFPPLRRRPAKHLEGKRVALLATGGSGALACIVGVARAFEESGVTPSGISLCSGSALFGFPLAAGKSSDEVAEFTLGLHSDDLVDVDWRRLAALLPTAARGFTGFLRGERVEAAYTEWLGDMRLDQLPVPAYAPVWNVERNELDYIGPRTHPELTVARAVRMAVALPLFIEAVSYKGAHYYDGGTGDIFPVRPLLDIEPRPDAVVAVNAFYPPQFAGDDVSGWVERPGSIFIAAAQVRSVQHIELAREHLARLRREVPEVMLLDPVPYEDIRGVGLYRFFFDNSRWPDFMRAGHATASRALHASTRQPPPRRSKRRLAPQPAKRPSAGGARRGARGSVRRGRGAA